MAPEIHKLRLIVEFDVEAKPGQSKEAALSEMATSVSEVIADADGCLYTNYGPEIAEAEKRAKEGKGSKGTTKAGEEIYPGPYIVGVGINRQDATNKPFIQLVEKTSWLNPTE